MKKTYCTPHAEVIIISSENLLQDSIGLSSKSANSIFGMESNSRDSDDDDSDDLW